MGARYADFLVFPGMRIEVEVDHHFRETLTKFAGRVSPAIERQVRDVLAAGPSKGGIGEALRYFGDEGPAMVKRATRVVEYLEFCENGFTRWLEVTGFGNDIGMIKALVAWSDVSDPLSADLVAA